MRASPHTSGTAALCFLPYKKKPNPTEPNSKLHRSKEIFISSSARDSRKKIFHLICVEVRKPLDLVLQACALDEQIPVTRFV